MCVCLCGVGDAGHGYGHHGHDARHRLGKPSSHLATIVLVGLKRDVCWGRERSTCNTPDNVPVADAGCVTQVMTMRGAGVAVEAGAEGATFVGVLFLNLQDTPEAVEVRRDMGHSRVAVARGERW